MQQTIINTIWRAYATAHFSFHFSLQKGSCPLMNQNIMKTQDFKQST